MSRALLVCLVLVPGVATAQSLVVDAANSPYTIPDTQTFVDVTVATGGTLVINGTLNATDMTVQSGATVTHDPGVLGLRLNVTGTLTIAAGGAIDADGKGLRGGNAGSAFGSSGEALDPITSVPVAGSGLFNGGSHAGLGGLRDAAQALNSTYGSQAGVVRVGSGGGGGNCSGPGGHGGGAVHLTAGTLNLAGTIRAMGTAGSGSCTDGGGGSGGGIHLDLGSLDGSGLLSARGGGGGSGGGGGGRIVVQYVSSTFTGAFDAAGGATVQPGELGTVWVKSTGDVLHLEGGRAVLDGDDTLQDVTFGPGAVLILAGAAVVAAQPFTVESGTRVEVNDAAALVGVVLDPVVAGNLVMNVPYTFPSSITVSAGGRLDLNAASTVPGMQVNGRAEVNARLDVIGDLEVGFGGVLSHAARDRDCHVVAGGRIGVAGGGSIDVDGRGLQGGNSGSVYGDRGEAVDPGTFMTVPGAFLYVGATHAGAGGGNGTTNAAYGSATAPIHLGSGGGAGNCSGPGGDGGGRVRLEAPTIEVNGTVQADGLDGSGSCTDGAGGSGGSVWIIADTFSGTGWVMARGGSGSGAGGGGRIAVSYLSSTFSGVYDASAGTNGAAAGDGTIQVQSQSDDLVVQNGVLTLTGTDAYGSITLGPGATLVIAGPATITQPIAIPAGATVVIESTNATANLTLPTTLEGQLIVNAVFDFPDPLTVNGSLTLNAPVTMTGLDVYGSVSMNARLDVAGDLAVRSGGLLTHAAGDPDSELHATGTVSIDAGGAWDVSGRGLPGGNNGVSGDSGRTIDPLSLQVATGAALYHGASHGGTGTGSGTVPGVYGVAESPVLLGGGGGAGNCSGPGGRGGGRVRIDAPTVVIDGDLRADAENGSGSCTRGGGGAGGSIWISTQTLGGAGRIVARGGTGTGDGGGGRIAITHVSSTFAGLVEALGAGSAQDGTVFFQAASGELEVVGGRHVISADDSYPSIAFGPSGTLTVTGAATVTAPLSVPIGSRLELAASDALANLTVLPTISGGLVILAPLTWPDRMVVQGALTVSAPLVLTGDLVLPGTMTLNNRLEAPNLLMRPGARITHALRSRLFELVVPGFLEVPVGAAVDADHLGLRGANRGSSFGARGETVDPVTGLEVAGSGTYNGGSHGGVGGQSNAAEPVAAPYDDPAMPVLPGGGGGPGNCSGQGGNGGGVIRITAGVARISGTVTARGDQGRGGCTPAGGGAGGSIFLDLGAFDGASGALIDASGGAGGSSAGGGGLIAIRYADKTYSGVIRALGGTGGVVGADGVVTETVVQLPPVIVGTPPAWAELGVELVYRPLVSGSAPIAWSLATGPVGAAVDPATGRLTWTPSAVGTEPFVLEATNAYGTSRQTFDVSVGEPPLIISTAGLQAWVGSAYAYDTDYTAEASGSPPMAWSADPAPAGFVIDASTGRIDWTPTAQRTEAVCIRVDNPVGFDEQCFSVVVGAGGEIPPTITSTPEPTGDIGVAWAYDADGTAEASGSTPITWSAFLAPAGFTIDPSLGTIVWTPASEGTHGACITATNAWGEDDQCFQVVVGSGTGAAPQIVSTPATRAVVGTPWLYDQDGTVEATGPGAIVFAKSAGPDELTIDPDTGVVGWTPVAAGNVEVAFTAESSFGLTEQRFNVSVLPTGSGARPVVIHTANPLGAVGVPYAYDEDQRAEAGGDAPITWSKIAGPPDFVIDAMTGLVAWVPTAAGEVSLSISASNAFGTDIYEFTVQVTGEVVPGPRAVATIVPESGPAPLTVSADASLSYGSPDAPILGRRWTFGDDTPPSFTNVATHTYPRPGSYVARLTVQDTYGVSDTDEVIVSVLDGDRAPPRARILVSRVQGADTLEVSFACECQAGSAPIAAHRWDLGGGTFVDAATLTHTFGPGAYEVRLTVVDQAGLTARDRVVIEVTGQGNRPPLALAFATPTSGEAPLSVEFLSSYLDPDGEVDSVTWDFGDGQTTDEPAPVYVFDSPGVHRATLTVVDDGGLAATASVEIEVTDAAGRIPPQILSLPNTLGRVGDAYRYDSDGLPAARGDRPLTWSLGKQVGSDTVGAPEGMTVDAATGEIEWTPLDTQVGDVPVALVVSGESGSAIQEWVVAVDGGPVVDEKGCGCGSTEGSAGWALLGLLLLPWLRRRR